MFYKATKPLLTPFKPVQKFFAVKSVIFATYWQSVVVHFIPGVSRCLLSGLLSCLVLLLFWCLLRLPRSWLFLFVTFSVSFVCHLFCLFSLSRYAAFFFLLASFIPSCLLRFSSLYHISFLSHLFRLFLFPFIRSRALLFTFSSNVFLLFPHFSLSFSPCM